MKNQDSQVILGEVEPQDQTTLLASQQKSLASKIVIKPNIRLSITGVKDDYANITNASTKHQKQNRDSQSNNFRINKVNKSRMIVVQNNNKTRGVAERNDIVISDQLENSY